MTAVRTQAFSSDDPLSAQEYFCSTYSSATLRFVGDQSRLAVRDRFRSLGPLGISDFRCTAGLEQSVEPMGQLALIRVIEGRCQRRACGEDRTAGPGEVMLMAVPDRPYFVRWDDAVDLQVVMVDPTVLLHVAGGPEERSPRFTSLSATPEGVRALNLIWSNIARHVVDNDQAARQPAILQSAARTLVAALLDTFANTAVRDVAAADRIDASRSRTLKTVVAYLHDHADEDLTVANAADAAGVSRQAVHLSFQRHLNTTPSAYLERVRLARAHRDLGTLDPATNTPREVALRWVFADYERFRRVYLKAYGHDPEDIAGKAQEPRSPQ